MYTQVLKEFLETFDVGGEVDGKVRFTSIFDADPWTALS